VNRENKTGLLHEGERKMDRENKGESLRKEDPLRYAIEEIVAMAKNKRLDLELELTITKRIIDVIQEHKDLRREGTDRLRKEVVQLGLEAARSTSLCQNTDFFSVMARAVTFALHDHAANVLTFILRDHLGGYERRLPGFVENLQQNLTRLQQFYVGGKLVSADEWNKALQTAWQDSRLPADMLDDFTVTAIETPGLERAASAGPRQSLTRSAARSSKTTKSKKASSKKSTYDGWVLPQRYAAFDDDYQYQYRSRSRSRDY